MRQFVSLMLIALCVNAHAAPPAIGGYHVYYGSLHNHSTVSDGSGTPAQAYSYARDVAKLDFFALADHESYPSAGEITVAEWEDIKNQADTYNNEGSFVAFRGFEWTSSIYGDVTVINTDDIALSTSSEANTFAKLKYWLSSRDCVAFFNHPGVKNDSGLEFDHFAGPVSSKFVGIELWNKLLGFSTFYYNDGYFKGDNNKSFYDEALSLGWKVGAAGAGDHHGVNWGTSEPYRLAILSDNLTRADLFSALKARRFYSTLDMNLALSFKVNDYEMGSTLAPGTYNFRIQATDADNSERFTEVILFDKNRNIKQIWTLNTAEVDVNTTFETLNGDYYYVKIKQADGDEAISSPIWIELPVIALASAETISPASNAIDNNTSTMWSTTWNRNENPQPVWLQLDYTVSQVFNQMSLTFNVTESVGRAPQEFKIQGSNVGGAGGEWIDLSAQSEQTFTSGETKVYSFDNSNSYRYYRLYITRAHTTSAIEVSELAFNLVIADTEKPTKPAGLSFSDLKATGFTLNWAVPSTDNVEVEGYEAYDGETLIGSSAGISTTMKITGLLPNTTYNVTLIAKDAAGNESDESDVLVVTTTDAPLITASNEAVGLPASNLIDGLTNTNWKATPGPTVAAPHWVQLQYANPQVFTKVTLTSCAYNNGEGYSSRDPRDWRIEGSNDASNWTILNTQTFSTASPAYCWAPKDDESQHEVPKQFSFENSTAFIYYRLYITDSNQSASSVMLSEIEFSGTINATEKNAQDKVNIYTQKDKIIVDLKGVEDGCLVMIFDLKGVNIASFNCRGNEKLCVGVPNRGIYLVKVQHGSNTNIRKVMIK